MMGRAVSMPKAGVITADPMGQRPIAWHALRSVSRPAAQKMAPHTPPPSASPAFAALTMASASILVMSPSTTSTPPRPGFGMTLSTPPAPREHRPGTTRGSSPQLDHEPRADVAEAGLDAAHGPGLGAHDDALGLGEEAAELHALQQRSEERRVGKE